MRNILLHAKWARQLPRPLVARLIIAAAVMVAGADAQTPIDPAELVAPAVELSGGNVNLTVRNSVPGRRYQLQGSVSMVPGTWINLGAERVGDGGSLAIATPYDPAVPRRFYWLALDPSRPVPSGFSLIPAGSFQMGDQSSPVVGSSIERPVHSVSVSAFYMGQREVTKAQWDEVRAWGATHGYTDLATGKGKAPNHPVQTIDWYSVVKWCNARSEKESLAPCYTVSGTVYRTGRSEPTCNWAANGCRLPTEAEWEKAARSGLSARNFPWGNTITHSQANYFSSSESFYDVSPTRGNHPAYDDDPYPYTSPVGSFAANAYGLNDMVGNVFEWCWDWYAAYSPASQTDPRGPASGSGRETRGGGWSGYADDCRVADRSYIGPLTITDNLGFRLARSSVP